MLFNAPLPLTFRDYMSNAGISLPAISIDRVAIAMKVTRIEHVQLAMPAGGEDRARQFYQAVLGIPEIPKPAHLARRGGCWFEREELKIHLGVDSDFRPARKAHPALLVSDLQTLAGRLRSSGYVVREDEPLQGYQRIYVDDPFGNRIELMEPDDADNRLGG
jgi:catechol 2,3-dioxygenase-like lactoylglutathione lyase family enzyme